MNTGHAPRRRPAPRRRTEQAQPPRKPAPASSRPRRWLIAGLGVLALLAAVIVTRYAGVWPPAPVPPGILLITIDTLRADHIGAYGDRDAATPVLDALAARGTLFETAICQVPLTLPSHASILTGLNPPAHGIRDNGVFALAANIPTLAEQLRHAGYATAAFVSGYPLHRRFGLDRGFDVYDDRFPRGDDPARPPYLERRADQTVRAASEWLSGATAGTGRPFFVWLHLFDPHAPYDPPEPFRTRFATRPYDGEVAFADAQIGVLLGELSRRGLLSNTIVLAMADHGEGLGEHGEPTHGLFIYDSTVRIPLIVAGPGVRPGTRVASLARAIDVAPTLLALAGVAPFAHADGRSLKDATAGRSGPAEDAYVESLFARLSFGWSPLYGWRSSRTMFIDAPKAELYDVGADPKQVHDVAASRPADVERYRRLVANVTSRATEGRRAVLDSGARARLSALGYTSSSAPTATSLRDPKDFAALAFRAEKAVTVERTDPALAADEFRAILKQDPENTFARQHLAAALSNLRRFDEALAEVGRLMSAGESSVDLLVFAGECYRVTGRYDEALAAYSEAAARDGRTVEPVNGRAKTLAALGRRDEARAAFLAALALAPDDADAIEGLADLALERGDLSEARDRLEALRARDGAGAHALLNLGVVLVRQGDVDRAIEVFQAVIANDPRNAEALLDLGGALAKSGRPADAVPYFERAVAAGAGNPVAWNSLAFARLETGNPQGAAEAFKRSLALRPDQPRIAEALKQIASAPQR